jgi:hypothetical protein
MAAGSFDALQLLREWINDWHVKGRLLNDGPRATAERATLVHYQTYGSVTRAFEEEKLVFTRLTNSASENRPNAPWLL